MKFGMPTLIENKNLNDTAKLCHNLGLDFVELNMNLPQYQLEEIEKIHNLTSISNKYGIYYTIHLDENLNICDFNNKVSTAYMNTVNNTIQIAKELEIKVINMHMNRGVYFTLPNTKVYLYEKYKDVYMDKIKRFREMCENAISDKNIYIVIENTDGYLDFQKEAIEYLLKSEVFGLTWDIGHSHSIKDIDEDFIMKHEKKLKHFHIHDAKDKNNHLALGDGEINIINKLKIANNNNCSCVIETKTIQALEQSVKWLKNMNIFGKNSNI